MARKKLHLKEPRRLTADEIARNSARDKGNSDWASYWFVEDSAGRGFLALSQVEATKLAKQYNGLK